ncbi:isopentenyl-diphosphate Delta-isomerase [Microbacterium kribbense]|uniref:Isopentenyl-diphosphate Delta-isomerase n=1 Tax=Microbacterium kribbense TaxID=433645 RepID=A0ABP7FZR2_9MICO
MEDDVRVVMLDEAGRAIGHASKVSVHGPGTAFHLAFSCHVRDAEGRVLITRRALTAQGWPGVWSNAFCGHPRSAEAMLDAVRRHADSELGLDLHDVQLVLPVLRYRAIDARDLTANEVCPVYLATASDQPNPRPDEVMEHAWVDPIALGRTIRRAPWRFSPWLGLQAERLPLFGGGPSHREVEGPVGVEVAR